jgi:phage/plasmid-like protein (TIGR03299 family)
MGHGLIEVNGKIPAAYANKRAWHSLGTVVEGLMTAEQVREHAGVDFEVAKTPLYTRDQFGAFVEVPGKVATIRTDTGDVLGAGMSEHYGVMQTGVMLDFLDNLVADAGMLYQSAGALHGGKTVWILASLGEEWTIGDSRHVPYILATTTHDGSGSVTVTPTTVNVVCANTLSAAMVSRDEQRINIRHTSGVVDNLRAASDTLKVATADQRRLQEFLATANETAITQDDVAAIVADVFGQRPDEATSGIRKLNGFDRKLAGFKRVAAEELTRSPNAFGMVQAITGYADHAMRPESKAATGPDRAFAAEFGGTGERFKREAIASLVKQVPALA